MKNKLMKNNIKYPLICSALLTSTIGLSGCGSSQKDMAMVVRVRTEHVIHHEVIKLNLHCINYVSVDNNDTLVRATM